MCRLHAGTALKREAVAADASHAMNRGTGTGLIVFGVILGVVGAIMAFAITVHTHGFNINTAGWILLVVGVVVLVIGIAIFVTGSRRSSTTVENVQSTPTGQERVEERRDSGTP
jgi:protein-S-isoprenylcysteine O-methyltransferase Ste14